MNTAPDPMDDNSPDASELLDFELIAKSQPEKSRGIWLWVVLILILGAAGWAGWMYLDAQDEEMAKANPGGVPLIMAPQFALKEKPSDPGGMKIPDRDKSVYNRMNGNAGAPVNNGVERLLPLAEAPVELPKTPKPAAVLTPAPAPQTTGGVRQPVAIKPVEAVAPPAPPTVPPVAPVVEKLAPTPTPTPKPTPAPASVAKVIASAPAGLGYMVQLSAVRTEKAALGEWTRLSKKHPDVLGSLESVIQRADLGSRGIFYRVRGGWIKNRADAKSICAELKRRNVGCIIVKP
ncbi:MAG: hypothetical protein COB59_04910 [Rhodospirillaceae bacterium]|nr:MAG: hypothetical protein COB59_04910 [Rhodospirillaceae bacterium]